MIWRIAIEKTLGAFSLAVELTGQAAPLAVAGPNGSGKTTLLRMIAGAQRPDRGHIAVNDRIFYDSARGIDLSVQERGVGYVPQGYGLFPHLRVRDNVAFGMSTRSHRRPRATRHEAAASVLEEVGCTHLADRFPAQLSGGEQQRVALARALVMAPQIVLLDEPLAAMDASARRLLRVRLAARLRAHGRPSIVVTHDVRDAVALGATVCILEQGRVIQQGSIADLRGAPASDFVAEFVAADLVPTSLAVEGTPS